MPKKRTPPLVVGCLRVEDTKAARMVDGSETLPLRALPALLLGGALKPAAASQ